MRFLRVGSLLLNWTCEFAAKLSRMLCYIPLWLTLWNQYLYLFIWPSTCLPLCYDDAMMIRLLMVGCLLFAVLSRWRRRVGVGRKAQKIRSSYNLWCYLVIPIIEWVFQFSWWTLQIIATAPPPVSTADTSHPNCHTPPLSTADLPLASASYVNEPSTSTSWQLEDRSFSLMQSDEDCDAVSCR